MDCSSIFNVIYLLLPIWVIAFKIILASNSSSTLPIHLVKCCDVGEEYVIGFDECRKNRSHDATEEDTTSYLLNRLKVHSMTNVIHVGSDSLPDAVISYDGHQQSLCPDGFIPNLSTEFLLFDNGSLLTLPHNIIIPERNFCIDQYKCSNTSALVARYCLPNPCSTTDGLMNCIRKCCPKGMAFDRKTQLCEKMLLPEKSTYFQLRDEFGVAILPGSSQDLPIILEAAAPTCSTVDMIHRFVSDSSNDCFSILPNGSMFFPLEGKLVSNDQYCVDHQYDGDIKNEIVGIICTPKLKMTIGENWLYNVSPYLWLASSIFMIATFTVYALIPEMRSNVHGISVMCHVASLAITYISLAVIWIWNLLDVSKGLCIGFAIVNHFTSLSAFTWLSVISFDIWWTFRDLKPISKPAKQRASGKVYIKGRRRLVLYSIYAWTIPLIFVLASVIIDTIVEEPDKKRCWFDDEEERQSYLESRSSFEIIRPRFVEGRCWFLDTTSTLIYLNGPVFILMFVNTVFFILTTIALHRTSSDAALATTGHQNKAKQKFRVVFSIFVLMGLDWILAIISDQVSEVVTESNSVIWIAITDIAVLVSGLIIFITLICKPTVWAHLQSNFPVLKQIFFLLDGLVPLTRKRIISNLQNESYFHDRN